MSLKNWRTICGRLALVVVAPVVFFGLLEGVLFLTGRFEPVRVLERVWHGGKEWWSSVPEYGEFALRRGTSPKPSHLWVPVEKTPGTLRVLLVGESAAAGYPVEEFGMARMLRALWRERFPDKPIEVVNLTMVGVSSHILREFVRQGMELEPDAVVFYMGHNEVIGPYGPAGRLAGFFPSGWMAQASLAVRNTRTGRFLEWGAGRLSEAGAENKKWVGLDEFAGARVAADDPVLDAMVKQTRENLREMVDMAVAGGSKALVCVPAVNLTDWPPLASAEGGEEVSAMAAYERAQGVWGNSKFEMGNSKAKQREEAWELYRRACDLDQMRLRADSRVRGVQREVVEEMASKDVMLVDADFWLHEKNPGFRTDRDFFLEHVHLTFEGRVAVAALMVDGLAELLGVAKDRMMEAQKWWRDFPETVAAARERVMFTEFDEAGMYGEVERLMKLGVFSGLPDLQERRGWLKRREGDLNNEASAKLNPDELRTRHRMAAAADPEDPWVDYLAARIFFENGRPEDAMKLMKAAFGKAPNIPESRLALWVCIDALNQNRLEDAKKMLRHIERQKPDEEMLPKLQGEIMVRQGDLAGAIPFFKKDLEKNPGDALIWKNLAFAQEKTGDYRGAIASYRRGVELDPGDAQPMTNLARLLIFNGTGREESDEAVSLAKRAVEAAPDSIEYRANLAVAYSRAGLSSEAEAEAAKVAAMAAQSGNLEMVARMREEMRGR
jgi:tetratricopeptide (TPR) repeat protein/lysophospholipase L1-like esterase